MTTKQYLEQVDRLNRMINNKLSEIYQLKTLICSISVVTEGEKVKSSISQDKLGDTIARIVDMEKEADEMIDDMLEIKSKIIGQVESIENTNYYDVLFLRYIKMETYKDISKKMNYSEKQVRRIHRLALEEFENRYFNEYMSANVLECPQRNFV